MAGQGRSLRIPQAAAGLSVALEMRQQGDESLINAWMATGFRCLVAALGNWLSASDDPEELAVAVVERFWRAVKRGIVVRHELALMACTARNARKRTPEV